MRDMVPGTVFVGFILDRYAVGIFRKPSNGRFTWTALPLWIRVVAENRLLNLALKTRILLFRRLAHQPETLAQRKMLDNVGDPLNQSPETAENGIGVLTNFRADFSPTIASRYQPVQFHFVSCSQFPHFAFHSL